MATLEEQYQLAAKRFAEIVDTANDRQKLRMYGLWNQVSNGDNTAKPPSKMSVVKYAKWSAYEKCKGMPKKVAMKRYISELRSLDPDFAFPTEKRETEKPSKKKRAPKPGTKLRSSVQSAATSKTGEPLRKEFKRAADYAFVSNRFKLENQRALLYAYYKQATEGPNTRPAPSVFSGRRKYAGWRAWANLFDMPKEEAMRFYVDQVKKISPDFGTEDTEELLNRDNNMEDELDDAQRIQMIAIVDDSSLAKRIATAATNGGYVYLITGASGFIGKHLLDKLVERNPNALMVCITRPGSNLKLAKQAVESGYASNIIPLVGNISKPNFELSSKTLEILKSNDGVAHMIHLAASYDMKASEEVNRISNVEGTRHAMRLAELLETKFEYVSSIVVSGDYNGIFLETMFAEGQDFLNPYAQTKYEAEKVVRDQCKTRYRIYRPGIVVGHSETGEADKIDGPYYFFKFIQHLRKYVPNSIVLPCIEGETMPIVPVDYVAAAMDSLIHNMDEALDSKAFHLVDPSPETFLGVLNIFAKAAHAPTFSSRLYQILTTVLPRKLTGAAQEIEIVKSAPHFLARNVLGIPEANIDYIQFRTEYDDGDTQEALAGTGIRCPKLKTYAWRLWDYYERFMDRSLDKPKALAKEIRGKVVVVTGSSDGIGRKLSERLGRAGAKVLLVARNKDKLAAVQQEIVSNGGMAQSYTADLSDGKSTDAMIDKILKDHGKVDILVNNAGRSIRRSVEYQYKGTGRFHDFERCIDLNFYGSLRCILGFLPGMREHNAGQVINISTIGAQTNVPRFGAYVASKSALDGFTRCIAGEIASSNVVLSTVYMPLVNTKMVVSKGSKSGSDFQNLISTDEAASMIERAMVTKERTIATNTGKNVVFLRYFFPSVVETVMHWIYTLESEKAPAGQDDSSQASGDKQQLKAIKMLFKGAF